MKNTLYLFLLLFYCSANAQSIRYYGFDTTLSYYPTDIIQTNDGGLYLAGVYAHFSQAIESINLGQYLVKTDANADTVWTRRYADSYVANVSVIQRVDSSYTSIGNTEGVYICNGVGTTWPKADFFVQHISKTGDSLSTTQIHEQCGNNIASIKKPDNSSIWMQLSFFSTDSKQIRRFSSSGQFSNTTTITPLINYLQGFEPTGGGFYLGRYDSLYKINASGHIVWNHYLHYSPHFMDLCQVEDGNLVFACASNDGAYPDTARIMKTDSTGNVLWNVPAGLRAQQVFRHSSGNYIVCGQNNDSIVVLAFTPNGNLAWGHAEEGYGPMYVKKSIELSDGSIATIAYVGSWDQRKQYALMLSPAGPAAVNETGAADAVISVFPNPATNRLFIKASEEITAINIYSATEIGRAHV